MQGSGIEEREDLAYITLSTTPLRTLRGDNRHRSGTALRLARNDTPLQTAQKQSIAKGTDLVNSILNVEYRLTCKPSSGWPIC
jgi:hypothetical protein